MCILGEPHSHSHDPRDLDSLIHPRGGLGIFTDKNQRISGVYFGVLNLENLYFFGYWSQLLYFLGLLNKRCTLKCFIYIQQYFFGSSFIHQVFHIYSTVFFWFQFYSPGASVIMGLHYCHVTLDFCEVTSVLTVFFKILLSESFFFGGGGGGGREGFLLVAKHFLGHSEMPNSTDPCL